MILVHVIQFISKGHIPVWLIGVTFLLPVTAGRNVEWRIEEYSIGLYFFLPRRLWEVNNEINIQEMEWEEVWRGLIWLRIRRVWGLL
jgi:hypothetical protein